MKGLLLKDWYLTTKYCRSFLLMSALFIAVSLTSEKFSLFLVYPSVFAAMLPVQLYSYDEKEKWCAYSAALPVSRAQYVSAKYAVGLLAVGAVTLVTAAAHGIAGLVSAPGTAGAPAPAYELAGYAALRWSVKPAAPADAVLPTLLSMSAAALIIPAAVLPSMLRFGAEKGRVAYYVMFAIIAALSLMVVDRRDLPLAVNELTVAAALCAAALALYALSWLLSVALYKKREL